MIGFFIVRVADIENGGGILKMLLIGRQKQEIYINMEMENMHLK